MTHTLVVGLGSPQGDDQIGWKVVELLGPNPVPGVKVVALSDPSRLWDQLENCRRLILIDATQSGQPPATFLRLHWPPQGLDYRLSQSSHGFGLGNVLLLAEFLGRLPQIVVIFAVEAVSCLPGDGLSVAVSAVLPDVRAAVLNEIQVTQHEAKLV